MPSVNVKLKPLDTTGAGDCFNGVLAVDLSERKILRGMAIFAIKAAAESGKKRVLRATLCHIEKT